MGKLEGKVAVITAATSGMALATARLFVEEGAYVFITGRRKEKLDEAVEEHLAAKRVIADLLKLQPDDKQFDAKMNLLQEEIEHHVEEEEGELFPKVRKNFGSAELETMGQQMAEMFAQLQKKEPRLSVPSQTGHAAPLD